VVGTKFEGAKDQKIESALRKIETTIGHLSPLYFYRENSMTLVEVQEERHRSGRRRVPF
jgi:hypothetical protein